MIEKQGPHIIARITLSKEGIYAIALQVNPEPLFEWTVTGDRTFRECVDKWLGEYAQGEGPVWMPPIAPRSLPPFTSRVVQSLLQIPFGQTWSYRELADYLGSSSACRAVGNGCGRNPWPLIFPCHRVISSTQGIGGFSSGGQEVKERLLAFERKLARESLQVT